MESLERKRKISSYDDLWSDEETKDELTVKKSKSSSSSHESKQSNKSTDKDKEKEKLKERGHQRPKETKEREKERLKDKEYNRNKDRESRDKSSREGLRDSSRTSNRRDDKRRDRDDKGREERDKYREERETKNYSRKDDRKEGKDKKSENGHSRLDVKVQEEKQRKEEEEYKKRVEEQMRSMLDVKEVDPDEEARRRKERREAILRKHQIQTLSDEKKNNNSSDDDGKLSSEDDKKAEPLEKEENSPQMKRDDSMIDFEEGEVKEIEDGEVEEGPHVFKDMDLEILRLRKQEDDHMFDQELAEEDGTSDMFAPLNEKFVEKDLPMTSETLVASTSEVDEEMHAKSGHNENERQDEFDMFSESPQLNIAPITHPKLSTTAISAANFTEVTDDAEGYYCYRIGEILKSRYSVLGCYGKGVFSTVLRATDTSNENKEVAIKVLRNNEAMKKMGLKEIQLLKDLNNADPTNKYNCIRLIDNFYDRDHLCLVFEAMLGGNLREVLKKYGTKIGLSIKAVKIYSQKMMLALKLLKKCKILHADIKLDNVLVNENKTSIKLGDFGSASPENENGITPYLVSRFYRAPEIILGQTYSYGIDMWSVGCCLYEIATGKILFPGKSNNEMLYMFMEVTGPINKKMQRKGEFTFQHFDESGNFKRVLKDKITKREYVKLVSITKPLRDLKEELLNSPFELNAEEKQMVLNLHDLLSKIFVIDPASRITVEEALRHPFIIG